MGKGKLATVGGLGLVVAVILIGGGIAIANVDLTNPPTTNDHTFGDGSIIEYIDPVGATGTGVLNSFVRVQANGTEEGYNTDGPLEQDTKPGIWTHSLLVSDVPQITIAGNSYREFIADMNENNSETGVLLTLNDVELYLTADPNLTGYNVGWGSTIWDLPDVVELFDFNPGSGDGDFRLLIPESNFSGATDCEYGSSNCSTYLVFYSNWGVAGSEFASDATFEEWAVAERPVLAVSKTAVPVYTSAIDGWTITKGDNADYTGFIGDAAFGHDYTIDVEPVLGDTTIQVTGTITIENTGNIEASVESIEDIYEGVAPTSLTCSAGPTPFVIAAGNTVTCDYVVDLQTPTDGVNHVDVTISDDFLLGTADESAVFSADSDLVVFGDPTVTGDSSVDVTDDNGTPADNADDRNFGPFTPASHAAVGYTANYQCPGSIGSYTAGVYSKTVTNTATIDGTASSDTAVVSLTCYAPVITKTVDEALGRTWTWDINKTADTSVINQKIGELTKATYSVTASATSTDGGYSISGEITVVNPSPDDPMTMTLADVLNDATAATISGCSGTDVTFAAGTLTVPKATTAICDYSVAGLDGDETGNTATATINGVPVNGIADINWSEATTTETDECIQVVDDNGTPGDTSDDVVLDAQLCADELTAGSHTYTYDVWFGTDGSSLGSSDRFIQVGCEQNTYVNVASFVTNDTQTTGSDPHTITINVDCDVSCTYTLGYWQTHSSYGPAPYDEGWTTVGEDTIFFLSGMNWYEAINAPTKGNAYYILAQQYVAATLNVNNDATAPAAVTTALADATTLFGTYTPDQVASYKDEGSTVDRAAWITLAGTLGSFNEGDIGPGHCDS